MVFLYKKIHIGFSGDAHIAYNVLRSLLNLAELRVEAHESMAGGRPTLCKRPKRGGRKNTMVVEYMLHAASSVPLLTITGWRKHLVEADLGRGEVTMSNTMFMVIRSFVVVVVRETPQPCFAEATS